MFVKATFPVMMLTTVLALGLIGCGQCGPGLAPPKPANPPNSAPPAVTPTSATEALPGLAELSQADRTAAEKQKICPKTRELLGSMGKPVKITVRDREIFLCCEGCRAAVEKDPDKYLKVLDDYAAANKK